MASVFLSYDRDDVGCAKPIANALEKAGHVVWWDRRIGGGSEFSKEIERALNSADLVVVLWTRSSIESPWVRDEAGAGRDKGRLVPLSIRGTLPPLGFRQFHAIDLGQWSGRGRIPQLGDILAAIDRQLKEPGIPTPEAAPVQRRQEGLSVNAWVLIALAIGMFFVVVGLLIGRPWEGKKSSLATVAISAADTSPASQALARDILAQLGQFQSARPDALQLVSADADKPGLLLEVAAVAGGSQSRGNLVLLDRKTKQLIWSKSFERPTGEAGDLRQQLGYTAAQVLQCAAEARPDGRAALRSNSLKLYLNSCAAFADKTPENIHSLVSQFRQLTNEEPGFADGWAKLLLAESDYARMIYLPEAAGVLRSLPAHIAAARAVEPEMPEAFLAEAMSQPDGAFERRIGLLQKALDADPDNASVLSVLSDQLRLVGRMNDSIEAAQRAVQADPLSPIIRNRLVEALTYGGKTDAALSELKRMEQTWPGASNVTSARFAINLRYGNPDEALKSIQTGEVSSAQTPYVESFLRARIDPTPANVDRAIKDAQSWYEKAPTSIYHLVQVLGTFGRNDQLFSILSTWPHPDKVSYVLDGLFRPALGNFHRDPRMMEVSKRLGLLDYWKKTGNWPDFCSDPDLPYDCKNEAARLNA